MGRFNEYLHRIGAAESHICKCGIEKEDVKHFLFRCRLWTAQRNILLRHIGTGNQNMSFFLGGKTPADSSDWVPNMTAIRATIKYASDTGRLDYIAPD
jgi:hypothetical protein